MKTTIEINTALLAHTFSWLRPTLPGFSGRCWMNIVESNAACGVDQKAIRSYRANMLDTMREFGLPTRGAVKAFAAAVRAEKARVSK